MKPKPIAFEPMQGCMICGEQRSHGQMWFLVTESFSADRLKVLHWQQDLAQREGMYSACSPGHVEELVIHWMTTGSLDFPFAATAVPPTRRRTRVLLRGSAMEPDLRGAHEIGELALHRESVNRLLEENPDSLQLILDELARLLHRECGSPGRFASSEFFSFNSPRTA